MTRSLTLSPRLACLRAAAILRERGHTKFVMDNAAGEVCTYGAIRAAIFEALDPAPDTEAEPAAIGIVTQTTELVSYALSRRLGGIPNTRMSIVRWNDHESTTQADAVALLEYAATTGGE